MAGSPAHLADDNAAMGEKPWFCGSFDSKEDYELYNKLLQERQRIQQQVDQYQLTVCGSRITSPDFAWLLGC